MTLVLIAIGSAAVSSLVTYVTLKAVFHYTRN